MRAARFVLPLVLLAACRAAVAPDPEILRPGGAPAVEALLREQQAAWNRGDLEGFAEGYWRSEDLRFLSGGSSTRGWDDMLARYRRRYVEGDAEMGVLAFEDLESALLTDDLALACGRWRVTFAGGEAPGGLFTLVLRRFPQGWRVVHDHTSSDE